MKRKMIALFLSISLVCTACGSQNTEPEKIENEEEKVPVEGAVPAISYTDFSEDIVEEETGRLLLKVTENSPFITLEKNEEAAALMNRVFEQQRDKNEMKIKSNRSMAESDISGLEEEELQLWDGYNYGYNYEAMYVSSKILSIKAVMTEEMGTPHPLMDVVSYAFYVPEGKLLTLSDIFADESGARDIVKQYIQDIVTSEKYQEYLLDDYESYVSDILTEDDFYLNEQGLVVICNPYLLTQYEAGVIEISVPYEALKEVINEEYLP